MAVRLVAKKACKLVKSFFGDNMLYENIVDPGELYMS